MNFTPQEEEKLILQYNRLLWRTVYRFQRRLPGVVRNQEDLYQEAALVFVDHLRKSKDMDEVQNHIPIRDMIHAMTQFVINDQLLSYTKRTSDFRKIVRSVPARTSYAAVDMDDGCSVHSVEDALDFIAVKDFLSSLSGVDLNILRMKQSGMDNRSIGKAVGETDVQICRHLKRLRAKYAACAA